MESPLEVARARYCSAFGPPVEMPMAMMRVGGDVERAPFFSATGGSMGTVAGGSLRPAARLATLIFSMRTSAIFSRWPAAASVGLAMKSTAPSASAFKVEYAPSFECVLNKITGSGARRMIRRSVSMPSMRGISRSRVTTSGRSSSIFFRANSPSIAVPTTSISGSRARIEGMSFRMSAESSTTRTRIFSLMRWPPRERIERVAASTAGTLRIRTTVPSPRIDAPLTKSLAMISDGSALMTSSSSPTRLSTSRPKRFSAAPMTMTKLRFFFVLSVVRRIDGVNLAQADSGGPA